jgi:hypothetical protein
MTSQTITSHRLISQGILDSTFKDPNELVRWMGCIQSQDFAGAKWAIGNRIKDITEEEIDNDFNAGKILRTHILRPTWHFVAPQDIRWLLELTGPRIRALYKGMHRKLEIDERVVTRSKTIFTKALQNGQHLTREELKTFLQKGKINTNDLRLGFLLIEAEVDGLICSGPRQGKQFTYALLEERVPAAKPIDRDATLAEIGKRYFTSHGPATLQDFIWWSGLTSADSKKSIELNKKQLAHAVIKGQTYWFAADVQAGRKQLHSTHLLPAYDEYAVAYKDRTGILNPEWMDQTGNGIFKPVVLVNGKIIGIWQWTDLKSKIEIEITPFTSVSKASHKAIAAAAKAYAKFKTRKGQPECSVTLRIEDLAV